MGTIVHSGEPCQNNLLSIFQTRPCHALGLGRPILMLLGANHTLISK
jgi:hypothetical protein